MGSDRFNDGGPAFPQPCTDDGHAGNTHWGVAGGGLSVRDYFAAAALNGLIQNGDGPYFGTAKDPYNPWPWFATEAYRAADAMLAASNAKSKEPA